MQRAFNEGAIYRARMSPSHEGLLLDGSFPTDIDDVLKGALLLHTDSTRALGDEHYHDVTLTVMTSLGLALRTRRYVSRAQQAPQLPDHPEVWQGSFAYSRPGFMSSITVCHPSCHRAVTSLENAIAERVSHR